MPSGLSQDEKHQQDYAAWLLFWEEPRLRKEAERKKAANDESSSTFDLLLGLVFIGTIIFVCSIVVKVYRYLVDIVNSALNTLAAFIPFL